MRTSPLRTLVLVGLALMSLLAVACGEKQKVGSEKLLEFEEQQRGGARLGEKTPPPAKETPGSLTVGETKAPTKTATPAPKATPSYFDVSLVPNSPYYKPGNRIVIRKGVTIRVTNKDATAERSKGRSFTDKHGSFHSGLLKPGATWTWTFNAPATYEVVDEGLNFATAALEVTP
jgi:hypothetical protein